MSEACRYDEPQMDIVECHRCHQVKACALCPDPYTAEIHPEDENPEAWWCEDCYYERSVYI